MLDPQSWSKPSLAVKDIPAIRVDLASPQSPDSVVVTDEFGRTVKRDSSEPGDDEEGIFMKSRHEEKEEQDKDPRLIRCLSDPGPAGNDEDEPFLSWGGGGGEEGGVL